MYVKNSEEKSEKLIFKSETNKTSNLWENFKRVFLNSEKQDFIKCETYDEFLIHNKTSGTIVIKTIISIKTHITIDKY
jgi:hypothetical protein